jgi:hypothetical protein
MVCLKLYFTPGIELSVSIQEGVGGPQSQSGYYKEEKNF